MEFLIVMMIVRFLIMLFTEYKVGKVEDAGADVDANDNGGIHPAEFELRDHYTMRCSE